MNIGQENPVFCVEFSGSCEINVDFIQHSREIGFLMRSCLFAGNLLCLN